MAGNGRSPEALSRGAAIIVYYRTSYQPENEGTQSEQNHDDKNIFLVERERVFKQKKEMKGNCLLTLKLSGIAAVMTITILSTSSPSIDLD
mmetsp:Transcript_4299/g.9134  ORF Transcript_4299/g.9134 Transcript_4299/m.9134 type:complete len:91 (-) Transcript_4299:69-341(-)